MRHRSVGVRAELKPVQHKAASVFILWNFWVHHLWQLRMQWVGRKSTGSLCWILEMKESESCKQAELFLEIDYNVCQHIENSFRCFPSVLHCSGTEIDEPRSRASHWCDAHVCHDDALIWHLYIRQLLMTDGLFLVMVYSTFWREKCMLKIHLQRQVLVYIILTLCFVLTLCVSGLICSVSLNSSTAVESF